ncbi:MAG: PLDc N-terminal domain-containing protein [Haloarculaceae archaeon]
MAGAGFVILFGLLMFVVFSIILPLWTYSDAQTNSSHSAVLWALVVFFGGLIGILLYFILGRDRSGGGAAGATRH